MHDAGCMTCVVVVYNKDIEGSATVASLRDSGADLDVVIVDNSTVPNDNAAACASLGYRYLTMGGNAGLSRAYNAAVDAVPDAAVIVLMDDDTSVPAKYFSVLAEELESHPEVDVFAPVVVGQDGVIWSPNNSNFIRNELVEDPLTQIEQGRFNAIASCLAIRTRVFDDWRFDERLFVDQVDQEFFDEQRERGTRFAVLPVTVCQSFYQRGEGLTAEAGWARLRLRIVDLMRHARMKGSARYVALGYAKCCGLGLQIARKSKAPSVFARAVALATSCLIRPR